MFLRALLFLVALTTTTDQPDYRRFLKSIDPQTQDQNAFSPSTPTKGSITEGSLALIIKRGRW